PPTTANRGLLRVLANAWLPIGRGDYRRRARLSQLAAAASGTLRSPPSSHNTPAQTAKPGHPATVSTRPPSVVKLMSGADCDAARPPDSGQDVVVFINRR